MKAIMLKTAAALSLLGASAAAYAMGCCVAGAECCLGLPCCW